MSWAPRISVLAVAAGIATVAGAAYAGSGAESAAVTRPVLAPAAPPLQASPSPPPRCPIPTKLRPVFVRAANETGLPLALLTAVAKVESHFHEDAVSHAGALGVMQVLPETAALYRADVHRTAENVLVGARYLDDLFDEMGSADMAISAYNAGPAATEAAARAPSLETLRYVLNVNAEWRRLNGCT